MSSITFANLKLAVRERADFVNDTDVITDAELGRIVNGEAAELHDLVVAAYEDDFTITAQFTISSGNTYALAGLSTPFYKLRGLDIDLGGGDWQEVRRFQFGDRNRRGGWARASTGRDVQYRLVGSNLYISPDDAAPGTYRIWYVPGFVDLSADGDLLSFPQNWHEMVIAGAAAKCLMKEESDPSQQLALKERAKARITAMAAERDASGPERIQRVQHRSEYDDDGDYP